MQSTPELIKLLDWVFSQFIRLLSADKQGDVKCFTCPNKFHWLDMQCGHFVPRKNLATRFELMNCHPQCKYCNEGLAGNLKVYAAILDQNYGDGTADKLKAFGKTTCKRPAYEYQELIDVYQESVMKLKANIP